MRVFYGIDEEILSESLRKGIISCRRDVRPVHAIVCVV